MKIRQLRVRLTRRPCGCDLFPERHILLLHRIEQKVIKMTLCADGHDILLHRRTCVCERRCILSKPVVGIGEIAAVAGLQSVLGDVPLHQHEIALMLGAHPPRGIPHVTNCKGSRLVVEFYVTAVFAQCLVHPPLVIQPSPHAQETDMRRTPRLLLSRIFIDMHNRQKHGIHVRAHDIKHRKVGAQLGRIEEGLIRIEYHSPVPRHMCKCGIARSGKVILPEEVHDHCTRRLCHGARTVRRPRIEDNPLIRIERRVFKPCLHIACVIAHKDRRRDADLPFVCGNLCPDRHPTAQLRAHLLRKIRDVRRPLLLPHKGTLPRRNRRLIAVQCGERLRVFRVHLRQLMEIMRCLRCNGKTLFPAHRVRPVDAQENSIGAACIDDGLAPLSNVEQRIMLRQPLIAEIVIRLREVAPAAFRVPCLCQLIEKKAQIPLPLLPCQHRRIPRMHQRQQFRRNNAHRGCAPVRIVQGLMDTPLIVPSRTSAKDARRIGIQKRFPRRLVDIVPRQKQQFMVLRSGILNHRTEIAARLSGKKLIRVNENNPVSRHVCECLIACGGKIIPPCKMMNHCTKGCCHSCTFIR